MSWKTRTRSTVSAAISCSVSGRGRRGAGGLEEGRHAGVGPGGFLDLLLLQQHLRGGLEALVLEQALDELAAGVFGVGAEQRRRGRAAVRS